MKHHAPLIIYLAFMLGLTADIAAQNFTRVDAGFPILHDPANILLDLDNDGDLDVFVAGMDETETPLAEVYLNNGGSFSLSASLAGVYMASCAAGDFNNDGLADLALCGLGTSDPSSKIYRNEGGGNFTDIAAGITGLYSGGIAWGDYNNDGWADLLISGKNASGNPATLLYYNDGNGGFTDTGISFTGLSGGSVAWSDIDRDEDLDFVVTGENASGNPETIIYINNGESFNALGAGIRDLYASSASWGDYNDDTFPDLLLTGADAANTTHTEVYENQGGNSFTAVPANLEGVAFGSGIWGDFDNDGKLDLVVAGQELADNGGGGPPLPGEPAKMLLYLNIGNDQFQDFQLVAGGVENNALCCGDYDNDSDLDILVSGKVINPIGGVEDNTAIYRNETANTNNPPATPGGLTAELLERDLFLSWDATTDDKTPPDGLNYNIRIGSQEGNMDVYSAMADLDNGFRRIAASGNVYSNTSWKAVELPFGEFFVSVQAIDPSYAGSGFSGSLSLEIIPTADFTAEDSVCVLVETTVTYTGNASADAQYNWDFDGATIVSGSGQGPYSLYWEAEGLKNLSLIVSENGVTSEPFLQDVMVIAYPASPGFIAGTTQVCQGTVSTEYYVPPITGAIEYEWSLNPPGAGNITGSGITGTAIWDPSFHGDAYVFVRGTNYCGYGPWSDSLEVLIDPLPEQPVMPEGSTNLCQGNSNTIYTIDAVSFASGYQWELFPEAAGVIYSNGLQAEVDWSVNYTGIAKILVSGYNSCGVGPTSDSLRIHLESPPMVDAIDNQSIPYGTAAELSGSGYGGSGDYSYYWMPDSLVLDPNSATTNTIALEQSVQFVLYVTDNLTGCVGSDVTVVTVTGGPLFVDALAEPEHVCSGEDVSLLALASGGTGNYSFAWTSDPPGFVSVEVAPSVQPLQTTVYYVVLTDTGEEAEDSVVVVVDPVPDPAGTIYGPDHVCAGDANVLYEIDMVPHAEHYSWELGEGVFGASDSTSILLTFAESLNVSTRAIRVKPVNSCGFGEISYKDISIFDEPQAPQIVTGPDTLCTTTDTVSTYFLEIPVPDAQDYEWLLEPDEAGEMLPDGLTATVKWVKNWDGEALIYIRSQNDCGTSAWSVPLSIHAYNCLGLADHGAEEIDFHVYPNPADGMLNVECWMLDKSQDIDLVIYDLFGRDLIKTSHPGRGVIEISISGIPAGMYILSLQAENGLRVSKRVVIQH
ncbi:MAG: FG-GAP-like repeat-containing protein [Bacteroidales bacterium]|jgi:hypothetical protein|nr:FG-GAP-like repeat-containing protein [Bacteroidales bacterium]